MRIARQYRGLVVTAVGGLLLVLGIALAVAAKPRPGADTAPPKAKPKATGMLDCKVLEQQLSKCGPAIAAAFDSGLGARLAKQSPLLRAAVIRTISQEFVARVAGPCFARQGKLKQGAALQSCLTAAESKAKATKCDGGDGRGAAAKCANARQLERCRTFAKCLAAKVRALPRPAKKTTPDQAPAPTKKPTPTPKPTPRKK